MRATRSRQKSGVKYFEAEPSMDLDDFRNQLQRKARVDAQQQAEDAATEDAAARAADTRAVPPSAGIDGAQPMDTDAPPAPGSATAASMAASRAADLARKAAAEQEARLEEQRARAEAVLQVGSLSHPPSSPLSTHGYLYRSRTLPGDTTTCLDRGESASK